MSHYCCWIHRLRCVIDYNGVRMRLENFGMYKNPSVYRHLFLKIWNFYYGDCYERLVWFYPKITSRPHLSFSASTGCIRFHLQESKNLQEQTESRNCVYFFMLHEAKDSPTHWEHVFN